jgi:predicted nucleic acid-binding protein
MAFVLDSSIALAWLMPDEGDSTTEAVASRLEREPAVAPAIWPLEIANALLMAQRRGRLTDNDVNRLLSVILELPVEIEPGAADEKLQATVSLARKLALTSYDAAYLELARRRAIPLATVDLRLREACAQTAVEILP